MSGIANARIGMGWRAPSTRRFCANCAHGAPDALEPRHARAWRCEKGAFYILRTAVCQKWEPRK